MKKLFSPLLFAFTLLFILTLSVGAFPGMTYNGTANATNISASLNVLSVPLVTAGADADVTVGTAQSVGTGSVTSLISTTSDATAAAVAGTVLGIGVDVTVASISSEQAYSSPSATNPDSKTSSLLSADQPLLTLGAINNNTTAALRDTTLAPSIANATSSLGQSSSEIADVGVGLPLLASVLDAQGVIATSRVETTDASEIVTQGYDAIGCNAQSVVTGLDALGLVSADAITTTTSANIDGKIGTVTATVQIVGLVADGVVIDPVMLEIGSSPMANIDLLGGSVVLSLAPVLEGSADANLATARATALRLEVVTDALGLGAGTVIEVGSSDVSCSAIRGNWNPLDDSDGDGVRDMDDLDDDNDGLPDALEGDATLDTDGDGIPDSRDLDSDNDGSSDVHEAGHDDADFNGDGQIDGAVGTNGLSDLVENPADSGVLLYTLRDSDGDSIPDVRDLDSDNDSIPDSVENGFAAHDSNGDAMIDGADDDFDGIIAPADGANTYGDSGDVMQVDIDGDGVPNSRDLDSDNDGTLDIVENGQSVLDTDDNGMVNGADLDGDGVLGTLDTMPNTYGTGVATLVDTDSDNVPNAYDLDSDNDGAMDVMEAGLLGFDPDGSGLLEGVDTDQDGVPDNWDTLPTIYGAGVRSLPDSDSDQIPDMMELDSDDDGTTDFDEYGEGVDANSDGMADGGDPDGDGIPNSADTNPTNFGLNAPTSIVLIEHATQQTSSSPLIFALILLLGLTITVVKYE